VQKEIRFQDPPTLGFDCVTGVFRLSYTLRLFAVEWHRALPVLSSEIVTVMRNAKLSICPHMATDDEAIIRRVVRGFVSEGINVSCGVCETECRVLEGYRRFGGADVVMNVVRNLGKLEKKRDPIWRAQLQGRYAVDG
jgi:succinate dehydrogenase/fumarate reductase-like Fe-S protein